MDWEREQHASVGRTCSRAEVVPAKKKPVQLVGSNQQDAAAYMTSAMSRLSSVAASSADILCAQDQRQGRQTVREHIPHAINYAHAEDQA